MLDVRLFRKPAFGVSSLTLTLVFFALMGIFFSISQLFQLVMGYGTFESALRSSPIFLAMIFVAPQAPAVAPPVGTRRTVAAGPRPRRRRHRDPLPARRQPGYLHVAGGMVVMAIGMALAMSPTTGLLMSAVPRERAGMGSAMNDTTRELGGSLGIAVLGSVMASTYASPRRPVRWPASPSRRPPPRRGPWPVRWPWPVRRAMPPWPRRPRPSYMSGMTLAMVVGAGIILVAAVLALVGLPADEPVPAASSVVDEVAPAVAA